MTPERFSEPEWIFAQKLDGIRLLAFKNGQTSRSAPANMRGDSSSVGGG